MKKIVNKIEEKGKLDKVREYQNLLIRYLKCKKIKLIL